MRILLITFYFPPYNTIGSIRTGKFAKYLHSNGHDVRVLTAKSLPLPDDLTLEVTVDLVKSSQWVNVNCLPELAAGGRKSVSVKGYASGSTIISKLGRCYKELINFPDEAVGWIPFGYSSGKKTISDWKPDLIYASATPYSSLIIGDLLSRRYCIPWIAEFRDLWSGNQTHHHTVIRNWFESRLEKSVVKTASAIVTVSQPLADTLKSKYSQPVHVVQNGFDPDDFPADFPEKSEEHSALLISYTGLMVKDYRDPSPLFQAVSDLGEVGKQITINFYGRYSALALPIAEKYQLSGQVYAYPSVSNKESLRIQIESDVLLHLLWNDIDQPGVLTGKLYEYLGARRPILAVGKYHHQDEAAQLIVSRGAGLATNDPNVIKQKLIDWMNEKRQNGFIRQLPESVHQGLTRADQFKQLEKILLDLAAEHQHG